MTTEYQTLSEQLIDRVSVLEQRVNELGQYASPATMAGYRDDLAAQGRQLQTLQGGGGLLEPLSSISGWASSTLTAGTGDPYSFVGQAQMLLSGSGITFTRVANTPFLQISANQLCYDYVVDAGGGGTHTTLFGASGALYAAFHTNNNNVTIWVCPSHYELVTEPTVFGGSNWPGDITVEGATLDGLSAIGPEFELADVTNNSYIVNTPGGSNNLIDGLIFRNLTFTMSVDGGSIFSGYQPIAGTIRFENCDIDRCDFIANCTYMVRGNVWYFDGCFINGWSDSGALFKTSTLLPLSFDPVYYYEGIYIRRGTRIEDVPQLIAGVGLSSTQGANIVIEDSQLLLTNGASRPWIYMKVGEDWEGTGSNTGPYSVRISRCRIEWLVSTSETEPFFKTDGDSVCRSAGILLNDNIVSILNEFGLDGTFFADLQGSGAASPNLVEIVGNTICDYMADSSTPWSPGHGTAVTVGANATNVRVDNVYDGFLTNVTNSSSSSSVVVGTAPPNASYLTINAEAGLSAERAVFPGNNQYITDAGANADVTFDTWLKGADTASGSTLTVALGADYFHVTGTTGITTIHSNDAGAAAYRLVLEFDGALTLTNSANLLLGGVNVVTKAGDILEFILDSAFSATPQIWRLVNMSRPAAAFGNLTAQYDQSGAFAWAFRGGNVYIANSKSLLLYSDNGAGTPATQTAHWDATTGHIGIGISAASGSALTIIRTLNVSSARAINAQLTTTIATGAASSLLFGAIQNATSGTTTSFGGATGSGEHGGLGVTVTDLYGYRALIDSVAGTGAVTRASAFWAATTAGWGAGVVPGSTYVLRGQEQGGAGVATAYGLNISAQTGTAARSFIADALVLGTDAAPLASEKLTVTGGAAAVLAGNEFRYYRTSNAFYVGFKAGSPAANKVWTLPDADGSTGQFLKTDGSAVLSWATAGSAASPLTTKGDIWGYSTLDARIPIGTDGQVLTADSAQALGLKWATASGGTHVILDSTVHTDTLTGTVVDGDIIIGNVTPKWSRLAISIPAANVRNVLGIDNGELRPSWKTALDGTAPTTIVVADAASAGTSLVFAHRDHRHGSPSTYTATAHNLLSATHGDTSAASPVRGDLLIGNSTPAWTKLAIGTTGKFLRTNGTDPSWQTIADTDVVPSGMKQTITITAGAFVTTVDKPASGVAHYEGATNHVDYTAIVMPDGSAKKYAYAGPIVMPDNYDGGTITAVFVWATTTADNTKAVQWGIQLLAAGDGDAIDAAYGTTQEVTDNANASASRVMISAATSAITAAGSPAGGKAMFIRVYRDPANASDNLAADARLIAVKLEYGVSTLST